MYQRCWLIYCCKPLIISPNIFIQANLIQLGGIIIDSKSGVSGAGQDLFPIYTFCKNCHKLSICYTVALLTWFTLQDVVPKRQIYTLKQLKAFILMELPVIVMVSDALGHMKRFPSFLHSTLTCKWPLFVISLYPLLYSTTTYTSTKMLGTAI